MYDKSIRLRAKKNFILFDSVEIYIFSTNFEKGQKTVCEDIVMKKITEEDMGIEIEPSLKLSPDNAQILMDDLWDCGIRPTEGAGTAGAMKKIEDHLKDLRIILFHKLGINK